MLQLYYCTDLRIETLPVDNPDVHGEIPVPKQLLRLEYPRPNEGIALASWFAKCCDQHYIVACMHYHSSYY